MGFDKGLVEGGELGLEILGVGVQLSLQILCIGGHRLPHHQGSLGHLHLDLVRHGDDGVLELLQTLVHSLLQLLCVGPHLALQLLFELLLCWILVISSA